MALQRAGAPVPEVMGREHAAMGTRPGAQIESVCGQGQHTSRSSCQAALQSPIKPTCTRTTSSLGSQILVTVTLGGAVPYRPQAALLPGILKSWGPGAIYTYRPCYLEFTVAQHY